MGNLFILSSLKQTNVQVHKQQITNNKNEFDVSTQASFKLLPNVHERSSYQMK